LKEPIINVCREIKARGAIPFARFMELVLYCPESGYYDRLENRIGRGGDFYTSVSVGGLFGELLAFQFSRWFEEMGLEKARLLEAGAHNGRLAADILKWLKSARPNLFAQMEYCILEPSERRRLWQGKTLEAFAGNVRWFDAWDSIGDTDVRGVIFANELLDAMPVHRLGWDAFHQSWFEWGVGLEDGRFAWTRLPNETSRLSAFHAAHLELPPDLLAVLPDGFTTEICPVAIEWWRQAAKVLKQGRVLTFEYGLTREQFFTPERVQGTLRAYHLHRVSGDLLANAGEQDLTAQVNFSALQEAGEAAGLKTEGLFSQAEYLTRIAGAAWKAGSEFGNWSPGRVREFQTLTHPEHLGRPLKVLVQSR
jgi:SAM-dependent MidA family methyltransferase